MRKCYITNSPIFQKKKASTYMYKYTHPYKSFMHRCYAEDIRDNAIFYVVFSTFR